ncbi:MAG: heavy-metal-associated domain-containing protein [Bacteroidota bacterium]|nr:heavy-metal-associated domain-containing protein [Bacteroidota bacterium]
MKTLKSTTGFLMLIALFAFATPSKAQTDKKNQTSNIEKQTKMKTVNIEVKGMSCQQGCADGLDKKFKNVPGVIETKTTFDNSNSEITFDESIITEKQIIEIIEARGFKAKVLEAKK